jgi:hypothetical protein
MTEYPLKIYEKLDPELLKNIENSKEFVFTQEIQVTYSPGV